MSGSRPLRAVTLLAVGVLVSACTGDAADAPATQTPTTTSSSVASPSPDTPSPDTPGTDTPTTGPTSPTTAASPTGAATEATAAEIPALSRRCRLDAGADTGADRVVFAVPEGWPVGPDGCQYLDPALESLPSQTEAPVAVTVSVSDQDFATVAQTEQIDGEVRHLGARSGYQAVRIAGESAGQALRPEGDPVLLWLVDLDAGTDEQGGALVLRATPSEGAPFALAAEAADRIAGTLRVLPAAAPDAPVVVTRTEGGGMPFSVTYDVDTGCFQLRPGGPTDAPADEACDVEAPDGGIRAVILSNGSREVVAGLAPPRTTRVASDAATAPYGAVTVGLDGAAAFAYDAIRTPIEVRALDAVGDRLATATVG